MGYRTYLAVVNREKAEEYRNHTPDMYLDENGFLPEDDDGESTAFYNFVHDIFGRREEFCVVGLAIPENSGEPFFLNPKTQEIFEHYNPRVVDKETCLLAIELMRQFVLNYYKEAMAAGKNRWQAVIHDKIQTWECPFKTTPYNLREDTSKIVRVMQTEYEIFEMVRIYKSIDWKKETVIFYGW